MKMLGAAASLRSGTRWVLGNLRLPLAVSAAFLLVLSPVFPQAAAPATLTVPTGFTEVRVAAGLSEPTAMTFAPDGRLFVAEEGGALRVIKNGVLLSTPFVTLAPDSSGERGLLGVAFDPAFATNHYVYVYYTAKAPTVHNRISRFVANGDVAAPGETVVFELPTLGSQLHNGGAIHFGADGKLYAAVGDNHDSANSQSLATAFGKMLRINRDGTIPTDNPFYGSTTGNNRAIWALGLRNPFTFSFDRQNGRMFINDVGESTWEEINGGAAGANFGWPDTEGVTTDPRFTSPIFVYGHGSTSTTGCAITGGAFYDAPTQQFPSAYAGDYFFADYCTGWIRKFDPATGSVSSFASGISSPVDLAVGPDGSLYYLARGAGAVYKVSYTGGTAPSIATQPASQRAPVGSSVTFSVAANGSPPLSYQWQRNGADISGATSASYTIASVALADSGARFRVRVTNGAGSVLSDEATLTVTSNSAPTATITKPSAGTLYSAGDTITYAGTGTDPDDGTLPASAFTWWVDFHHNEHIHPFLPSTSGSTGGSFTIPTDGETDATVWYRIHLRGIL